MSFLLSSVICGLLSSTPSEERVLQWTQELLANARTPRGAAPLFLLASELAQMEDLTPAYQAFSRVAKDGQADERIRALARMLSAQVEYARGRTQRGQAWLEPMGFLKDFWLISGFDNEGQVGCQREVGPEGLVDLNKTYAAKFREVAWRKLVARPRWGYVDLSSLLPSNKDVVSFVFSQVETEEAEKLKFYIGASGAFSLFVNGQEVLSSLEDNLARLDQAGVELRLPRGRHQVLLKLCQTEGPTGFFLRVEGNARPIVTEDAFAVKVPPSEKLRPQPLESLSLALQKALKRAPGNLHLKKDLALVLHGLQTFPKSEHRPFELAKGAAEAAPEDFELQMVAARLAEEGNERYKFLLRAQGLAPNNPWLRLQMAARELEMQRPEKALHILEGLEQQFPQWGPLQFLKIQAIELLGGYFHAANMSIGTQQKLPSYIPLAIQAAAYTDGMGWKEDSLSYERLALSLRFSDTDTRLRLAAKLSQMGRWEEEVRELEEILRQEPLKNFIRIGLARVFAANGQAERALELLALAKQLAPEESAIFAQEAQVWLGIGEGAKAMKALREAAALAPQKTEFLLAIEKLSGERSMSEMPHAVDVEALGKATLLEGKEEAVVLANVKYQRIQATGHASRWAQYAVRLHSERAVEEYRRIPISYAPSRQALQILRARILKPNGTVVSGAQESESLVNEAWAGMYYDVRARVLDFSQLAVGDILELQWRLDDTAQDNLLSDYWGTVELIADRHRVVRWKFVVDLPEGRRLYDNADSLPPWVSKRTERKGERVLTFFEAGGIQKVVAEPYMPGLAEVATPLHVSTYAKWEDVGDYWWGLIEEQLAPNEEIRKTVVELLKGVDVRERRKVVEAIYGFVVSKTRYVALEFGIYGFKPYRVSRILSRGFGDCKDKAALMHVMLKEAGIASKFVLLRMNFLGRLASTPASLAAFNHAILYVPEFNLFLDGTAEFHGISELPSVDAGANALIIEPQGRSRFLTTPALKAEDNWIESKQVVSLNANGDARLEGEWSTQGQLAPGYRQAFSAKARQEAEFLKQWGQAYPGIQLSAIEVSEAAKLEEPFRLKFSAIFPRYAEVVPEGLRFYALGYKQNRSGGLGQLATRRWPLELPEVFVGNYEIVHKLSPGWRLAEPGWRVEENSPFGEFSMGVEVAGGKVQVRCQWKLKASRVEPKDYPAFRAWLLKVEQIQNRRLFLKKP
ncbi:MAG: DUF3857 domain-containing protein [Proteobacteria bacterium]|nr:DUF3857 domain-containing protein [Cystobacterineae bacterium]MCL2259068.1 DUF3857 domain-containing protein [Cystobacterineae bacterium]MCL2314583.1 DUF3857 domain-containing protein [Pseudomonadota bacterium]